MFHKRIGERRNKILIGLKKYLSCGRLYRNCGKLAPLAAKTALLEAAGNVKKKILKSLANSMSDITPHRETKTLAEKIYEAVNKEQEIIYYDKNKGQNLTQELRACEAQNLDVNWM